MEYSFRGHLKHKTSLKKAGFIYSGASKVSFCKRMESINRSSVLSVYILISLSLKTIFNFHTLKTKRKCILLYNTGVKVQALLWLRLHMALACH
jgi:hypothetical protein